MERAQKLGMDMKKFKEGMRNYNLPERCANSVFGKYDNAKQIKKHDPVSLDRLQWQKYHETLIEKVNKRKVKITEERNQKLILDRDKKEKRFQNKMKELASRDPREMYRNSKIDIHARKLDRANRDYQFTAEQQEHIIEAFE